MNTQLGAVLIKNYASLDENKKGSMCFFLKRAEEFVLKFEIAHALLY
jgi:hypothetical protein